jgi:uncharacterized membrane protein
MSRRNRSKSNLVPKPANQNLINNQKSIQEFRKMEVRHEGPLPHPKLFQEYDAVLPGAAERILSMAEKQASHRQNLELTVVKAGSRDSLIGLIFGFILGLFTVGGGIYCIIKGQSTGGTILSGAGLVTLVGVFVYGSRQQRSERQSKKG